ncbi:type VI secretion system tip protein TssI/VgrG [Sorangium sp. So ce590]|uniref:type VI secretion system Vgr family protein n=1 Tax=Sorangium sp. So ce590 TaxID=3133317 RepID=UPI003F5E4669
MINQAELQLEGLDGAEIVRVSGREAMNELGAFVVEALLPDPHLDTAALVDRDAILGLADASGFTTTFHLVALEASHEGHSRGKDRYRITLGPPAERLALRVGHAIFQDRTTQEIVAELLLRAGIPASQVRWRLAGQYAKRDTTVQYGESEWAFIARLLADEGINGWFDRDDDTPLLVFGDHPSSHEGIEGPSPVVPFEDASGRTTMALSFHALRRSWSITSTRASLRDINVQNPDVPVDGDAGEGALEVFEYPSGLVNPKAAAARAQVRLEQLRRHRSTLVGESGTARLRAGRVVQITGAADACFSGRFLITAVEHELVQASREQPRGAPYKSRATLVPFAPEAPYRPEIPRSRPVVAGIESAIVTGPAGDEIHVDDLGRIKVRFFWDRSGVGDDKSSRWVRTLQMNLTAPQMLPRVGWEVPVVYENGDPDRPFVLGRIYNGGAAPPYALPDRCATSTLQSATSPGGGTTNEIRLGDDGGSEQTFVHATKDQTVSVGGSHSIEVGANRLDTVQKGQQLLVDGGQTTTIGGNQSIIVGADGNLVVKGARSESIGGNETIGVTGTYKTAVDGAYVEQIGALYSLRCNEYNAKVQGAFTQVIGAALSTTAGLGSNQSVAGARTELVSGVRSFTAALAYADGTTGRKSITAAAANESANAKVAFNAGARATLQAGGVLSIEGGGKVVFEAGTISVKAATLTANGGSTMKLAGALKSSSTVKLDAPSVKKNDKVKVGP